MMDVFKLSSHEKNSIASSNSAFEYLSPRIDDRIDGIFSLCSTGVIRYTTIACEGNDNVCHTL